MNAPAGYKWLGRKIRHAHAPVGERREVADCSPFVADSACLECGHHICSCTPKPTCAECGLDLLAGKCMWSGKHAAPALETAKPAELYGCRNRITDDARLCAESGHYFCERYGEAKPAKPAPRIDIPDAWRIGTAEPELRPGWSKTFSNEHNHVSGGYIFAGGASRGGYIGRAKGDTARWYGTLEAAMRCIEERAR